MEYFIWGMHMVHSIKRLNMSILHIRTQFVTTQNDTGFVRKKAQTISFVERGFERLGLGHRTAVSHDVYTELNCVRSRSPSP